MKYIVAIILMILLMLPKLYADSMPDKLRESEAIRINTGDPVPYAGILMSTPYFMANEAEFKECEYRLKNQRPCDSPAQWRPLKFLAAGLLIGWVARRGN